MSRHLTEGEKKKKRRKKKKEKLKTTTTSMKLKEKQTLKSMRTRMSSERQMGGGRKLLKVQIQQMRRVRRKNFSVFFLLIGNYLRATLSLRQ